MLRRVTEMGHKNFYKEIGLSQHFTWKGFFRRSQRLYPRTCTGIRFALTFFLVFSSSSLFIPGANLPFQKPIKLYVMNKVYGMTHFWYIKAGVPDIPSYLSSTYLMIDYILEHNLISTETLNQYLERINKTMEPAHIEYRISEQSKINNIFAASVLLSKLKNKSNFQVTSNENGKNDSVTKFADKMALIYTDKQTVKQFKRIIANTVLKVKEVNDMDKKQFAYSLRIFQYLFRFGDLSTKKQSLNNLALLLQNDNLSFLSRFIIKDESLKNELKIMLHRNPELKPEIIKILELTEKHRKSFQK